MTWQRRARVQVWLARILVIAFVAGGTATAAAAPGLSARGQSTASLTPGARSAPFSGADSAIGADALTGSANASSSAGPHHPDAATTAQRTVAHLAVTSTVPGSSDARIPGSNSGAPPARAPPLV